MQFFMTLTRVWGNFTKYDNPAFPTKQTHACKYSRRRRSWFHVIGTINKAFFNNAFNGIFVEKISSWTHMAGVSSENRLFWTGFYTLKLFHYRKNRLAHKPSQDTVRRLTKRFAVEEANMFYLRHPYLTCVSFSLWLHVEHFIKKPPITPLTSVESCIRIFIVTYIFTVGRSHWICQRTWKKWRTTEKN